MIQRFADPSGADDDRRLRRAAGLLFCVFAAGCATETLAPPTPYPELARAHARRAAAQSRAEPTAESDEKAAYTLTDRYLVYPVAWGRADELAATLEPIIQARYGPEARVVAHSPSNRLFIHIPAGRPDPSGSRATSTPQAAATPQPAASPRTTSSPRGTATRRATTRGTQGSRS